MASRSKADLLSAALDLLSEASSSQLNALISGSEQQKRSHEATTQTGMLERMHVPLCLTFAATHDLVDRSWGDACRCRGSS